jgi:hypothetical protein
MLTDKIVSEIMPSTYYRSIFSEESPMLVNLQLKAWRDIHQTQR